MCVIQIYIKKNLEVTANLIEKVSSDLRLPEIFSCNKQGALVLNAGFATRLSEEGPRFAQSCTTRASFVLPILFNKGLSQKLFYKYLRYAIIKGAESVLLRSFYYQSCYFRHQ